VSKKLPGIRLFPIELEIGRKPAAERTKAPQQFFASRLPRNTERPGVGDMNFNVIAFLESGRFDHRDRKADSETVAPLTRDSA
jgi:hypothetical protein